MVRRPVSVMRMFLVVVLMACSLLAERAAADPLALGDNVLNGTTSALRPELGGLVLADLLIPYDFLGTGGEHLLGDIQNRVVRSSLDGTFDFYWRIRPDPASVGDITALRVGGFDGFALDGDYRLDGLGNVGPGIARNFGGGFVNFIFKERGVGDGVSPNESSYFFFLDTQATNFSRTGSYDLLCADSGCISPLSTTFAPTVPEPSSIILLGAGGLALLAKARSRRKKNS